MGEMGRIVQQRCFHRGDSLHLNPDMCYCFTASGSPATQIPQRGHAESDPSWRNVMAAAFIIHFFGCGWCACLRFLWSAGTVYCKMWHLALRKQVSGWRCGPGHVRRRHVWSGLRRRNASALCQVRSADGRETEQSFKLKPRCNCWFPRF